MAEQTGQSQGGGGIGEYAYLDANTEKMKRLATVSPKHLRRRQSEKTKQKSGAYLGRK